MLTLMNMKSHWQCVKEYLQIILINPGTHTQIHTPSRDTRTPPQRFWYVAVLRKDFAFSWKPLIFSTRWGIFYRWWRCWRQWRHQQCSPSWPPSWILPRILRNQVKTAMNGIVLCLTYKKHINKHFASFHPQALLLLLKKVEKMHFHSKMAWPPATYDVISRNHSNRPSLNLSQNACEG